MEMKRIKSVLLCIVVGAAIGGGLAMMEARAEFGMNSMSDIASFGGVFAVIFGIIGGIFGLIMNCPTPSKR